MALFDLTVPELERYGGRTPRPADFDDYWSAGKRELASVDADVRFESVAYPSSVAETTILSFTGIGGARVFAKYLRPRVVKPSGALVVAFHGYAASSGDWYDRLGFVAQGHSVLVVRR